MDAVNDPRTVLYWNQYTLKDLRKMARNVDLRRYSRWDKAMTVYMMARLVRKADPRAQFL